jgi:hypothetical protein
VEEINKEEEQAGVELCQAQFKLGLAQTIFSKLENYLCYFPNVVQPICR